jgi:hypothetical protein
MHQELGTCTKIEGPGGKVIGFKKLACKDDTLAATLYADADCRQALRCAARTIAVGTPFRGRLCHQITVGLTPLGPPSLSRSPSVFGSAASKHVTISGCQMTSQLGVTAFGEQP